MSPVRSASRSTIEELVGQLQGLDLDSVPQEEGIRLLRELAATTAELQLRLDLGSQRAGTYQDEVDSVLTVKELADELKLPRSAAYELVRTKELRSFRIGKHIRVQRPALDDYLRKVDRSLYGEYSPPRARKRAARRPTKTRPDSRRIRRTPGRHSEQRGAVGAGRNADQPARRELRPATEAD